MSFSAGTVSFLAGSGLAGAEILSFDISLAIASSFSSISEFKVSSASSSDGSVVASFWHVFYKDLILISISLCKEDLSIFLSFKASSNKNVVSDIGFNFN